MTNFFDVKQDITKKSLEFAKYNELQTKDKKNLSSKEKSVSDINILQDINDIPKEEINKEYRHMLEHLSKMLNESEKQYLELLSQKENIINYLRNRDVFFELTDGFSLAILYYTAVNLVNTLFASSIAALHLGFLFAALLNPIVAVAVFTAVATYLLIKYLNKSNEEKNPAVVKFTDDLEELNEEIDELLKHVSYLIKESTKSHEIFSEDFLHNENVASHEVEINSPVELTTFFLIGNVTSSVSLAASTIAAAELKIPSHLLNIFNHISGMSLITKEFASFQGINPFYFLVFLSCYIPMKIYDYNKYEKHHKKIGEEILNVKVNMQQIDFVIKLNESLSILNNISANINNNKDLEKKLESISNDLKSKLENSKPLNNDLAAKLQSAIFTQISANYSNLSSADCVKTFFYLSGKFIKSFFISNDYIDAIQNLTKTISRKITTLNTLDYISDTNFEREESLNSVIYDRLNSRINKISKNERTETNNFIKDFAKLINTNYNDFFENLEQNGINTHQIILTYFNYINNGKLKKIYEAVKHEKSNDIQCISGYLPEILHVLEQELNLDIAYKTSKIIEYELENNCNNKIKQNKMVST